MEIITAATWQARIVSESIDKTAVSMAELTAKPDERSSARQWAPQTEPRSEVGVLARLR